MTLKSTIIVTGCDAKFFYFMDEALQSIVALGLDQRADIGILDLGLTPEQIAQLEGFGCKVVQPNWTIDVPDELRVNHQIGLIARTALREYFPGYRVYLWFDADAWAQTPEFFTELVQGAQESGLAIIRETGAGMKRNLMYNKWWYGHMIKTYGLFDGIRVAFPPSINIGIMALSDTTPVWDEWIRHYKRMIDDRRRTNMDQHAFAAAVQLGRLPARCVSARNNWIATLSPPAWDAERKLLCEPVSGGKPLSVIHLAGPDKRRDYSLKSVSGPGITTALTYPAFLSLSAAGTGAD